MRRIQVDFSKKLRDWDGFGVTYVETAQTPDYDIYPQDYGGFGILHETDRSKILDMIFGEDGLKPGLTKMFLDPFHQKAENTNNSELETIDLNNYDHKTTTRWMRYFVHEGLRRIREQKGDLKIITTLYGPPGWMTKQGFVRGRDLAPQHKLECVKYMISWAKYLREKENLPVKYISFHNEGESYYRWPEDGSSPHWESGHDYNMLWSPEQVVEFLKIMREMLDKQGMADVGLTPGETTNLYKFLEWGYAYALADDPQALSNLGLITSHGFIAMTSDPKYIRFYGDHRSAGFDIIREKRPDLHCWITSASWSKMDVHFVNQIRGHIYSSKINALIPWAITQKEGDWKGGDPNPGTAFRVHADGSFSVQPGYYYYKQVCRAGQAGMSVARVICNDSEVGLIAFGANGTDNPDAFIVLNLSNEVKKLDINIIGTTCKSFQGFRTSPVENYIPLGRFTAESGVVNCEVPAGSVTTFYGIK